MRQIRKNHREGGSSVELVARDTTGHLNKIRRSSAIATIAIHKTIHKDFCLPSKSHFYNLPISSPGHRVTFVYSLCIKKCWCIGAFSRNHLNIKENIAFFSWCATGFFVVHLVHFVRKKPANA